MWQLRVDSSAAIETSSCLPQVACGRGHSPDSLERVDARWISAGTRVISSWHKPWLRWLREALVPHPEDTPVNPLGSGVSGVVVGEEEEGGGGARVVVKGCQDVVLVMARLSRERCHLKWNASLLLFAGHGM